MKKEFKLTKERFEELQKEIMFLKTVREREVAEQIKEARSFGDLSENSEYDEAKNEQGKLFSRIAEIENILSNAVLLEYGQGNPDAVAIGATVTVADVETGDQEVFTIVGTQEADPIHGRVSDESLFGRALLGHAVGDTVVFESAAGTMRFTIESISI